MVGLRAVVFDYYETLAELTVSDWKLRLGGQQRPPLDGATPPFVSFREVCARLGMEPSSALYVGDSPWADIQGARRAGMRAVWVNRHAAPWPEDVASPETAITSLDQLVELLEVPA